MAGVADQLAERGDHVGIGEVFLLRNLRHDQVPANEPDDQFGLLGGKPVLFAENLGVDRAEFRVVAAAALGDVVEERRDIEQPGAVKSGDGARAERVLMRELGHREAPDVAQNLQDVLVDRVNMEQVVLHLPDDAPEGRQVGAEDVELVHAAEFVDHAAAALQQFDENGAVCGFGAKRRRDEFARPPQGAQGAGRHAVQIGMFLHDQETAEDQRRIEVEGIFVADVEQAADRLKIGIDRMRKLFVFGCQRRPDVLHQDGVGQRDGLGIAVIALHQAFRGTLPRGRFEAVLGGQRVLVIEQQAVLAASDHQVQADAQVAQVLLAALHVLQFLGGQEAIFFEIGPGRTEAGGARDPEDDLEIAQAARRFLEIGFEAVGRLVEAQVAFLLFEALALIEQQGVKVAAQAFLEGGEQVFVAGQQAGLDQGGLHRNVAGGLVETILYRAHAMSDLETDVPEVTDQALESLLQRGVGFMRQQNQEVDVGSRVKLAAPVAANRGERQRRREIEACPEADENVIDLPAARTEQILGVVGQRIGFAQGLLPGLDFAAQGSKVNAHQVIQSGLGRQPADSVRTS